MVFFLLSPFSLFLQNATNCSKVSLHVGQTETHTDLVPRKTVIEMELWSVLKSLPLMAPDPELLQQRECEGYRSGWGSGRSKAFRIPFLTGTQMSPQHWHSPLPLSSCSDPAHKAAGRHSRALCNGTEDWSRVYPSGPAEKIYCTAFLLPFFC